MEYTGKLYGCISGIYFDTGKTSKDYDKLEKRVKELEFDATEWHFIANGEFPEEMRNYTVLDKFGNQGSSLWGNSGYMNEPTSFFDTYRIKAQDIIAWKNAR